MAMLRAAVLSLMLALPACASAADVEIARVWPGWRDAASFKRISEYFTGLENDGTSIVRRTQIGQRAGLYFLVRVHHPRTGLEGAKFVLRVVAPDSPEPRTFEFPAGAGPGEHVYELGLTGTDWKGKRVEPVAWKLDLFSAGGAVLASAQSFLWAMPDRKS
jgi:hypothetical protein